MPPEIIYRGTVRKISFGEGKRLIKHQRITVTDEELWSLAPYANDIAILDSVTEAPAGHELVIGKATSLGGIGRPVVSEFDSQKEGS